MGRQLPHGVSHGSLPGRFKGVVWQDIGRRKNGPSTAEASRACAAWPDYTHRSGGRIVPKTAPSTNSSRMACRAPPRVAQSIPRSWSASTWRGLAQSSPMRPAQKLSGCGSLGFVQSMCVPSSDSQSLPQGCRSPSNAPTNATPGGPPDALGTRTELYSFCPQSLTVDGVKLECTEADHRVLCFDGSLELPMLICGAGLPTVVEFGRLAHAELDHVRRVLHLRLRGDVGTASFSERVDRSRNISEIVTADGARKCDSLVVGRATAAVASRKLCVALRTKEELHLFEQRVWPSLIRAVMAAPTPARGEGGRMPGDAGPSLVWTHK